SPTLVNPRFLFHVLSKRESDTESNRSRREFPYHSCLQPCRSENASRKRPNSCPPACPPFGVVHCNKMFQLKDPIKGKKYQQRRNSHSLLVGLAQLLPYKPSPFSPNQNNPSPLLPSEDPDSLPFQSEFQSTI
ncbi:hypothetical protein GOODEAATRI_014194, partial [Goodea atripinnis]